MLVLDQSLWPAKDGSSGLMSYAAIQSAIKAGTAIQAPSNFFLFFSSYAKSGMSGHNM